MKHDWTKRETRWMDGDVQNVSVPFTWLLPDLRTEFMQRDFLLGKVRVGGPALKLMPDFFSEMPWVEVGDEAEGVLQRMNPLATRTTVGCVRRCSFCAVPITEGVFRELDDWPDLPIICDNNLLAASQKHFDRVCDRLEKHQWCDFNQGLDARIMNMHHVERLARLPNSIIRLALDHSNNVPHWMDAFHSLHDAGVAKKRIRTYVLCGFNSGPEDAWERCNVITDLNSYALPQWYHPLNALEYNAVCGCHRKYGWTEEERDRIMAWHYQHRGERGEAVTARVETEGQKGPNIAVSGGGGADVH